jgi:hypothetical protein
MHRLLIAAASAAFIAAVAAPALADEYPPCTHPGQDHCREVPMTYGHHHHHHPAPPPHHPSHHPHGPHL